MTLPERNPFILLLYVLLIAAMFGFMYLVAWLPLQDLTADSSDTAQLPATEQLPAISKAVEDKPAETEAEQPRQKEPTVSSTVAAVTQIKKDAAAKITTLKGSRDPNISVRNAQQLVVRMHPYKLKMDDTLEKRITTIWNDFYKDRSFQKLTSNDKRVYVVYRDVDLKNRTVKIGLGYPLKNNQAIGSYLKVALPEGRYLKASNVFDSWQDAHRQGHILSYSNDYEIYELDRNYNIRTQTAWMKLRQE